MYALLLRGYYFNVSGGVGFISLFGIATMSGVLFVSRTNHILKEELNLSVKEAVRKAAIIQLRPMLMTMLLALLGLIPATLASGVGSDVQRPLATVIVGGLFSAMILVLTVMPSLYLIIVGEKGSDNKFHSPIDKVLDIHLPGDDDDRVEESEIEKTRSYKKSKKGNNKKNKE
jgi:cobalt-zinc-cadmium resistance protein CzcA